MVVLAILIVTQRFQYWKLNLNLLYEVFEREICKHNFKDIQAESVIFRNQFKLEQS